VLLGFPAVGVSRSSWGLHGRISRCRGGLAKTLCGFCVVGGNLKRPGISGSVQVAGDPDEELVDISLFFPVHLGFAVSWVDSGQCYGLLPLLYPYFSIVWTFVTRGSASRIWFYGGKFWRGWQCFAFVLLGLTLGFSFWRLHFSAHSPCSYTCFGETGGLGFGKAFGKHSGAWRAKRCVVCWVCSQSRAQMAWSVGLVRVCVSFWGARRQVVFLSTLLFCSRGLLWDMYDGVERAGWFGASSVLLSGFGGFSWAFSPASSGF
jgi:hypothetical protein